MNKLRTLLFLIIAAPLAVSGQTAVLFSTDIPKDCSFDLVLRSQALPNNDIRLTATIASGCIHSLVLQEYDARIYFLATTRLFKAKETTEEIGYFSLRNAHAIRDSGSVFRLSPGKKVELEMLLSDIWFDDDNTSSFIDPVVERGTHRLQVAYISSLQLIMRPFRAFAGARYASNTLALSR
jgi:hypothetical protein